MNSLKKLIIAISLTIMLAGTALADCPAPVPGEVNTPPCTTNQQVTEDLANLTAASPSALEIFLSDTLISVLEDLLTVY